MILKVPWTKTMLNKFIDEALLSDVEEKILRTRIAGWSIIKQSMEMGISTASISRIIKNIQTKYMIIQPQFPNVFPPLKIGKYEQALDATTIIEDAHCAHLLDEFTTQCGKNIKSLSIEEIIECQKKCPYESFYKV